MESALSRYTFLFGGTAKGHLLIFGKGGTIIDRYQLHLAGFTQMLFDDNQHVLVTASLDETIHISTIHPLDRNIVQLKIEINAGFIPRQLSIQDKIICSSTDDATIHMFEYKLKKNEWKVLPGHIKTADHSETVTGISSIPRTGLFASVGNDSTLRIWDRHNRLVREIHFQEPLESLCVANERGDLLIAMKTRIDLVRYHSCTLY